MDLKRNPDINANTEKDLTSQDWDDEIDLQKAVFVAATWWREIVLGVFLAAIMGGVVTAALEVVLPRYEASTNVAILHDSGQADRSPEGRRASLVGLIHHTSVEKRVLERLQSDWPEDSQYVTADLFKAISIELVTAGSLAKQGQSDLLRISAKSDSPESAMILANTWTEEYIIEMNEQNSEIPSISADKFQTGIREALVLYEDAQDDLEVFVNENKITHLTQQIGVNSAILEELHNLQQKTSVDIFNRKINHQLGLLDQYYNTRLRLIEMLEAAESLHAQIVSGGDAGVASNELAIMMFKVHAYTTMDSLPDIEVDFGDTRTAHANAAGQSADMEAVIAALKDRLDRINRNITHQSDGISSMRLNVGVVDEEDLSVIQPHEEKTHDAADVPVEDFPQLHRLKDYLPVISMDESQLARYIIMIDEKIRSLQTELESEDFKRYNLIKKRNQARSNWETIMENDEELQLSEIASRPALRLVSSATTRKKSLWPSPVSVAAVSGVVGSLIMVSLAFSMNSVGVRPFLKKRGTEHTASARTRNPGHDGT